MEDSNNLSFIDPMRIQWVTMEHLITKEDNTLYLL